MKPFLLFLFYAVITSVFSFGICFTEFIRCFPGVIDDDKCVAGDFED